MEPPLVLFSFQTYPILFSESLILGVDSSRKSTYNKSANNLHMYALGNVYDCIIVPFRKQCKPFVIPLAYFVAMHKKRCCFMGTLHENAILKNIVTLCQDSSPKISPSKMCTELGLSRSLITKLKEKPTRTINGDTAQKIADYFGVSVDRVLGSEQKEKPAPTNGNGLDKKSLDRAKKLSEATPDIQSLVDAILNDESYRPKVVDKIVEVVCPLSGRVERIEQRYFVHDGKRIPDRNNGCDNCYACSECDSCRISVMESVR